MSSAITPTLYRQHDFCQQALSKATGKNGHLQIRIKRTIANTPQRAYVVASEEVPGADNAPRLIAGVCDGMYADDQF